MKLKLQKTLEQGALLGAYPILALSVTGFQAVAGLLVVTAAAVPAGLVSIWLRRNIPASLIWLVNVAVAAGVAITASLVMPYILPIPELSTHVMAIAGITPIAFVFCRPAGRGTTASGDQTASGRHGASGSAASGTQAAHGNTDRQSADDEQPGALAVFASFAAFVMVTTIIREVLGSGALFANRVTPGGAIPAGIMSTHAGGFLILALILFAIRVYGRWQSTPAHGNGPAGAQSADGGTR
ncbi:MAG: hypothetical protein ACOCRN_01620 [Spirochaetia bacterium]